MSESNKGKGTVEEALTLLRTWEKLEEALQ
jgi:hypothetical protein